MWAKGKKIPNIHFKFLEFVSFRKYSSGKEFQSLAVLLKKDPWEREVREVSKLTTKDRKVSTHRVIHADIAKGGTIEDISEEQRPWNEIYGRESSRQPFYDVPNK